MTKLVRIYKDNIIINKEYIQKFKEFKKLEAELKPMTDEVKKDLLEDMQRMNKKTVISNGMSVALINGYVKTSIDSDKLRKLDIDLYNKCLKTSNINTSLKISVTD